MNFGALSKAVGAFTDEMLPGACARVSVHGKNVFAVSAGMSDAENQIEMRGDEVFSAYSMTKPLTACLALMAWEKGLLDPDAPLCTYLPEFREMNVLIRDESGLHIAPAKNAVTVYRLLTMSAGFGSDMTLLGVSPTRRAISSLTEKPLLFEPGEHWLYGLCYEVLGAVLEEVYRLPLRRAFSEYIFKPCGMTDSRFLSEITDYSQIVPVYRAALGTYESAPLDLTYAPHSAYDSGGAGLVTTAKDYENFLNALMGGKLLKEKSLALMKADSLTVSSRPDFSWPQTKGYGYGCGVRVPLASGGTRDYGWGGAAGAYCLMDFDLDACLVFFTNVLNADETVLYPRLRSVFYESIKA